MPRPSSPVYAKASTNCPYLTLENPHHHRQACLHYTASNCRRSGLSSDRYKTSGRARDPAGLGALWISQLDNHCCDLIDRLNVDRQPRHRFLEPIHNVKDGAEAPTAANHGSGFFIPGKSLPPLRRQAGSGGGASRDRTDDLKLAKLALSQLS